METRDATLAEHYAGRRGKTVPVPEFLLRGPFMRAEAPSHCAHQGWAQGTQHALRPQVRQLERCLDVTSSVSSRVFNGLYGVGMLILAESVITILIHFNFNFNCCFYTPDTELTKIFVSWFESPHDHMRFDLS